MMAELKYMRGKLAEMRDRLECDEITPDEWRQWHAEYRARLDELKEAIYGMHDMRRHSKSYKYKKCDTFNATDHLNNSNIWIFQNKVLSLPPKIQSNYVYSKCRGKRKGASWCKPEP